MKYCRACPLHPFVSIILFFFLFPTIRSSFFMPWSLFGGESCKPKTLKSTNQNNGLLRGFTKKKRIQDMENCFLSQLQDLENASKILLDLLKGDLLRLCFPSQITVLLIKSLISFDLLERGMKLTTLNQETLGVSV